MKKETYYKELKDKGFTLVEIVVIIAIMVVLLAILSPSLLRYTENSRKQKDDSAMDELCNTIQLALADAETFDEACSYVITNNYVTYTDSSGLYGAMYADEEFWAPDGSGNAVTITFNPDENGNYTIADGLVNDMTYGNGSVADSRTADDLKQCYFSEMGVGKLYQRVEQTFGAKFSEKSATYKNSSYTVFVKLELVDGVKRANVYGLWNGTNLSPECPASLGSGTSSYTEEEEPEQTKSGGTTQSNYTNSDLIGSGGSSGAPAPSYKKAPCGIEGHTLNDGRDHETISDCGHYKCECAGCIIPEGGKYTTVDGTVYGPGDKFPAPMQNNDNYEYGHYKYRYMSDTDSWWVFSKYHSYSGPAVLDPVLHEVNNRPITKMRQTFAYTYYPFTLKEGFVIPDTVTDVTEMFSYSDVTSLPSTFVIPEGITDLNLMFRGSDITNAPIIPEGVTNLANTFYGCSKLKTYIGSTDPDGDLSNYVLPSTVTSLQATFQGCSSIVKAPNITKCTKITYMGQTFYGCSSMANDGMPQLPSSVQRVSQIFSHCSSLTDVSHYQLPAATTTTTRLFEFCNGLTTVDGMFVIPETLTSIEGMYYYCKGLTDVSSYHIPEHIKELTFLFDGCDKITAVPPIGENVTKIYCAYNGCKSLVQAPIIPSKVGDMRNAFNNCISLTGTVEFNNNNSYYINDIFKNVDFEAQNITLTGTHTKLDTLGATGINYCADCNGKCQNNH